MLKFTFCSSILRNRNLYASFSAWFSKHSAVELILVLIAFVQYVTLFKIHFNSASSPVTFLSGRFSSD
jgi:hypothetical protein